MTIRLGWLPSSIDHSHPADRRRLGWFLNEIDAEIFVENAQPECHYDILYVTISADIGYWSDVADKLSINQADTWVVFDICDSLLVEKTYKDWFRSLLYCFTKSSCYFRSYRSTLIKMIRVSDSVVCGSQEQRQQLLKYNPNIQVVRDSFFQDFDLIPSYTPSFLDDSVVNILWEGLSHGNASIFKKLLKILESISSEFPKKKIVLHFVTDPTICKFVGRYFCEETIKYLNNVFKTVNCDIKVYDWSADSLVKLSKITDVALIPIPDDPVMKQKPENKLILFWYLNIPVVCTGTPSYARVMSDAGLSYCCDTESDWVLAITKLISSKAEAAEYTKKASSYIGGNYTHDSILESWFNVFKGSKLNNEQYHR